MDKFKQQFELDQIVELREWRIDQMIDKERCEYERRK